MSGSLNYKKYSWLILILLLGTALRLYGLNFGLPERYHADEPIVVNHALAYGTGDFNPHFFKIPPLLSYLLFVFYLIYFMLGNLTGLFHSASDFGKSFLSDPTVFYLAGRFISGVVFGSASIWGIYRLGKKIFGRNCGIISALILSVAFLHVQNSHYIYVDIPLVFFIVMTSIAVNGILKKGSLKYYLIAGVFAGLASAVKYNGALIFVAVAASMFCRNDKKAFFSILFSLAVTIVTFIILNPYAVLDWHFFISQLRSQAGVEYPLGALYHIRYSLVEGVGVIVIIGALIGMLGSLAGDWKTHLVYLSFPLLFYLVLVVFSQHHERYVLPLLPFLIVYASAFLDKLLKQRIIFYVLMIMIVVPNLFRSIYSDYLFTQADTRTQSREWVEKNIENGAGIAIEHSFFCPRLNQDKEQIVQKSAYLTENDTARKQRLKLALELQSGLKHSYKLFFLKYDWQINTGFLYERPQIAFSIADLRKEGVSYVILHIDSDAIGKSEFYKQLLKDGELVKEFSPYKDVNKKYSKEYIVQTAGPFWEATFLAVTVTGILYKYSS